MSRTFALESEVVGRSDNSFPEMMLPQTIDDDSSHQRSCPPIQIGHPLSQRNPRISGWLGLGRNRWGIGPPQNLNESRFCFALLVVDFTSTQEKNVLPPGDGRVDFGEIWPRHDGIVILNDCHVFGGFGIER